MEIRIAEDKHILGILSLLRQVNQVHADGRPDLFKSGGVKYTESDLKLKLTKEDETIFVAEDGDRVLGYIFGVTEKTPDGTCTYEKKTFYIDDFCVDVNARRMGVGRFLYEHTKAYAKDQGFDRITLHVWDFNAAARDFYEALGMTPMYTCMEDTL